MKKIFIALLFLLFIREITSGQITTSTKWKNVPVNTLLGAIPNSTATRAGLDSTVRGATGIKTWTTGDILYSNATNGITKLGIGSTGQLLTVAAGIPSWATYTGSTSVVTLGTVTTGTWSATAIGTTKGGTNLTSYTTGDLIYGSASNVLSKLGVGSTGQVLTVAAGVPSWATPSTTSPGGSNTYIQFNNSGTFGGSANFTYTDAGLLLNNSSGNTQLSVVNGNVSLGDQPADFGGAFFIIDQTSKTYESRFDTYIFSLVNSDTPAHITSDGFFVENITEQIPAGGVNILSRLNITKGTVTQATSITTGVTLDKQTGVITTVSSTLGAGASATFILTDSYITSASEIQLTMDYNGTMVTNGTPYVTTTGTADGSAVIQITNLSLLNALNNTMNIHFTVF